MFYYRKKTLNQVFILVCLALFSMAINASIHPKQQEANEIINQLYHNLDQLPKSDMATRLDRISAQFLNKLYILCALGEGADSRFDQEPLYRTDAFDCDTYVTTVLALALAHNGETFKQCLRKVRYQHGQVEFIRRNHFMSLDWNPNNQEQGFIKDITETFKDKNGKSVAKMAEALIDKPSWYQRFSSERIRLNPPNKEEQEKRLSELKAGANQLPKTLARIPYLPFSALFNKEGQANQFLFVQIPHAAIIEIVRPNWDLRDKIGTNLNVSHLGFAFWRNGVLYFRQASSQYGRVVEVPLISYLKETLNSPTIKGINVEVVVPQHPLNAGCTNNSPKPNKS